MSLPERIFWVVLSGFAVYRAAQLLVLDAGPFMLFKKLRRFLGQQGAQDTGPGLRWSVAEAFTCAFCLGMWLALIPAIWLSSSMFEVATLWMGIAGIQSYLQYQSMADL